MIRRNRRPDWRRIKTLRSYTVEEAAALLGVHRNAVRHWIRKAGLPAMTDRRPHLVRGTDLVAFLKGRRESKRQRCGPSEFFCLKCREPRRAAGGMVEYKPTTSLRGTLLGICPACEGLMRRFTSRDRLKAFSVDSEQRVAPAQGSLVDTPMPALSCASEHKEPV